MKKITTLFFIFLTAFLHCQTQIGNDIDGKNAGDQLGWSTAISKDGSIIAVGASGKDDRKGYVQVYKNENGTWSQLGNDIIGDSDGDYFGSAIDLSDDGTVLAIGAKFVSDNSYDITTGIVKVYKLESNNWVQMGNTVNGGDVERNQTGIPQEDIEFGSSISLNSDGTILVVGAPKADYTCHSCTWVINCGQTRIYDFENNDWGTASVIYGEAEEDNSGNSISLNSDGTILAIGAANNDGNGNNSGHVRVYIKNNNNWIQTGNESTSNGKDINGENAFDLSGYSVSLSGDGVYVAIGAPANDGDNGNKIDSGHVISYYNGGSFDDDSYNTTSWFNGWQEIDGVESVDQFGYSVSMSDNGGYIAAGSIDNDSNGSKSGQVRIFKRSTAAFDKLGIDINGEASGDQAGFSVSISGDGTKVLIGAPFNDGNGGNSGHVRVYDLSAVLSSDSFVLSKFSISPNPAKNLVTIQLKDNLKLNKLSIYNSLGQFVKSSRELSINTSKLSKGVYFLQVETNLGSASKKLIIE